jgi:hypothetical protein
MRPLAARCHLALGESYRGGRENVRADEHLTRARALIEELALRVEETPAH